MCALLALRYAIGNLNHADDGHSRALMVASALSRRRIAGLRHHGEVLKLEKNPHHAEELVRLLTNKQPIFRDGDGTVVTVRDATADVFEELDDPAYWLGENALEGGDCGRVHIPALTEAQFSRLRRKLGKVLSKSN